MVNITVLFSLAFLLQYVNSVPLIQNEEPINSRHNSVTQCASDCQENIASITLQKEQFQNAMRNVARDEELPFREEELLRVQPQPPVFLVPRVEQPPQPAFIVPIPGVEETPPAFEVPAREARIATPAYVVPVQEAEFSIQGPHRVFRTPRMVSSTVLAYLPVADIPLYRTFIHGFDSLKGSVSIEDSGSNTVKRDAYDDFRKQLAHDAIMPNILPTMQIPEVRSAGYGDSERSVQAVYPTLEGSSSTSRCAVPLLFGCSPRVVIGALAKKVSSHEPFSVPGY